MVEPLSDGCRYELDNGGVVEVIRVLVNDEPILGLYFRNSDGEEKTLGLTKEAAEALLSGLMHELVI